MVAEARVRRREFVCEQTGQTHFVLLDFSCGHGPAAPGIRLIPHEIDRPFTRWIVVLNFLEPLWRLYTTQIGLLDLSDMFSLRRPIIVHILGVGFVHRVFLLLRQTHFEGYTAARNVTHILGKYCVDVLCLGPLGLFLDLSLLHVCSMVLAYLQSCLACLTLSLPGRLKVSSDGVDRL